MAVAWTQHRFSGGILALDTANTVVLRIDPARRFDRFDDPIEIARFAEAASVYRSEELGGRAVTAERPDKIAPVVLEIRETTDRLFREAAVRGGLAADKLSAFLTACSAGLSRSGEAVGAPDRPFGDPAAPLAFETALSVSALSLLAPETVRRLRICRNCGWLFVDRSRNSSRMWCDMAVCGNREKAKRHYRRRQAATEEMSDVRH